MRGRAQLTHIRVNVVKAVMRLALTPCAGGTQHEFVTQVVMMDEVKATMIVMGGHGDLRRT